DTVTTHIYTLSLHDALPILVEEVRKDSRIKKNQRIEYHLKKLLDYNLITISIGWEKSKKNTRTGKSEIDRKKRTIKLTPLGEYRSEEHTSELQSRSDLVCRL